MNKNNKGSDPYCLPFCKQNCTYSIAEDLHRISHFTAIRKLSVRKQTCGDALYQNKPKNQSWVQVIIQYLGQV